MKTLTGVIALMLALMFGVSNVAVAAEKAAAPTAAETSACRGKPSRTKVKLGGKDYTCPQGVAADPGVPNDPKPAKSNK